MASRITVTLHELVAELDVYADGVLHARYGVSFNLFEFLATLAERGPIDITGLAHCLRITKAAVSKRVPALVADGWIRADRGNGRRVVLSLTPKGADLVQRAGGELEAEFTEMLADPRLDPAVSPGAIDTTLLNTHLTTLTAIVLEKGSTA
ncbi:MAG: transcriptional regulator [Microbacterium sp. SCN 70-200]|uniref:MarR family transcriptional regulator n=1 Tax=unclassified Microbacterium TaxID=2609290 RepID=UPI00086E6A72|nr:MULTISPECIES: MarR family transcriptional regulator [unclassified Microbacterium]MBN9213764.1 MarR family transcriptional regulator [Microbacterium sp.]ODT42324.1 MAG: transcriptional regulator [Microbacterium sp. SCN 70-200]OJV85548.1 MAG: transcriptional regulator [Microbacterium sp. 70-16]